MCQAKPGPRCASHTSVELRDAKEFVRINPDNEKGRQALMEAQIEYYSTKTGQKELNEKIELQRAIVQANNPIPQNEEDELERIRYDTLTTMADVVNERRERVNDLVKVSKALKSGQTLNDIEDVRLLRSAGTSPRMSPALAKEFVDNGNTDYMVAGNKHVDPKLLDRIYESGTDLGRRVLCFNPSLSNTTREKIINGTNTTLKSKLAQNPHLTQKHRDQLLKQDFPNVNKALKQRKDNTPEFQAKVDKKTTW